MELDKVVVIVMTYLILVSFPIWMMKNLHRVQGMNAVPFRFHRLKVRGKKGGNRKGSVHLRQPSYPVSDLSVLTAFRRTYNTFMNNTSLSRRSAGDYMLWNRASRALPQQD